MYKMVIADDEKLVREGLATLVDWSIFNIEIVGYAKNGAEALSLCEDLEPDILFTDIRMPHLSGIDVMYRLRESGYPMRFIILSGYDDFVHAQNAIALKVEHYILKPIKVDNVIAIMTQVISSIKKERENAIKVHTLSQQLHDNLPAIRSNFLMNLLCKDCFSLDAIKRKIDFLNLPFTPHSDYIVSKLIIDQIQMRVQDKVEENHQLILMSIHNVIDKIIQQHTGILCFTINDMTFILIACQVKRERIKNICVAIQQAINHYLNIQISIGIGNTIRGITHMYKSYITANEALEHQFYTGVNAIIDISDINKSSDKTRALHLSQLEDDLLTSMKTGKESHVKANLDTLFSKISSADYLHMDYTRSIFIELVALTTRSLYEINENMNGILGEENLIAVKMAHLQSYQDMKHFIYDIFNRLTAYFSDKLTKKKSYVIDQIKEIIRRQYTSKLTVQVIAEQVSLTPNYISQIFKKDTGMTINQYLKDVRVTAAKELLTDSNFKVFEVAEMVGFDNPYYFSTVFKKATGIHPSRFN